MDFIKISLRLSIIVIALFSTYASVLGLGSLFVSTAIPVMIAGAALELGKYSALSIAYTNWKRFDKTFKTLLSSFIVLLMVFTSAGVFSYLGKSYQETFKQVTILDENNKAKEEQLEEVNKSILNIEQQISNLPSNSVNGRIKLLEAYKAEKESLLNKKQSLETSISDSSKELIQENLHAGPIVYLSKVFNSSVEYTSTVVILLLTVCLDPFAIFLTLLYNKSYIVRISENEDYSATDTIDKIEDVSREDTVERNTSYYSTISPQLYKDIAEGKQPPLHKHIHENREK